MGIGAYYCPECKKKRKEETALRQIVKYESQRKKKLNKNSKTMMELYKRTGEIIKENRCPNYDKASVSCVTCPDGAWKFKWCGREK